MLATPSLDIPRIIIPTSKGVIRLSVSIDCNRHGRFEARLMCAQAANSKTSSGGGMDLLAMKHINELSAVGPCSDKLDAVVREHVNQLQAANLKDQDAYCQYTSATWDSLNPFVREAVRAITVAGKYIF